MFNDGNAGCSVLNVHEARIPLAESMRGPVVLGLRPESLQVGADGTPARVIAAEPMGREVLYTADSSFGVIRFLDAGADARHAEGDNIALSLSPDDTLLFDKTSGQRLDALVAAVPTP